MRVPAETTRSSSEASVVGTLTFTEITEAQALRVARHPDEWSVDDLYAYVAEEIIRLNGPQLPCKDTQQTIEGFCSRFTIPVAVRIARAAFEVYGGKWQGAPITWRRFTQGHDEFFATPLLASMA